MFTVVFIVQTIRATTRLSSLLLNDLEENFEFFFICKRMIHPENHCFFKLIKYMTFILSKWFSKLTFVVHKREKYVLIITISLNCAYETVDRILDFQR